MKEKYKGESKSISAEIETDGRLKEIAEDSTAKVLVVKPGLF